GAYYYGGKLIDVSREARAVADGLKSSTQFVFCDELGLGTKPEGSQWTPLRDFAVPSPGPLSFEPVAFDAPLYIMFSSGTTGVPKCIVHSVGGTLIQHLKELRLHCDVKAKSRLFFYTTCGWMMWNWMVSALAADATIVTFDGALNYPNLGRLWELVRDERIETFGTSPKFISTCMGQAVDARAALGDFAPRTILTTGSPLLPEHSEWIQSQCPQVHLASISGGTDIISCFMLGVPTLPVRSGEIQRPGLGMAIEAWDAQGKPVRGEKGELVCTKPFPSMPLGFWNDGDGKKYHDAYFAYYAERGRDVWRHGDFVEVTADGGIVVYGRSDATLNPGGVRIGTAELYRQVEAIDEIADSLAIGKKEKDDTVIVLFVKLKPQRVLDASLVANIKSVIRSNLTPRHVPKEIIQVQDIPYTRSGKKVEMAVTEAVHGQPVKNLASLSNPESIDEYVAMGARWSAL
ncbi:hypothetical protein E3A20_22870, partial [Planctomyces bekefii]